jgi:penicillin-binding protein 2
VAAPHRLTPGLAVRVGILGAVAIAVFGVLLFRLWSLQVLSGDRYLDAAQNNQLRTIRVEAPRGPVLDRNGKVIVGNVPGTAVKLWVGDMPKQGRYDMIKRLAAVLDVAPSRLAKEVDERRGDPLTPITVKTAVHDDQVNYLLEHQSEFPGVQIQGTSLRHYRYQSIGAQILGYVGEISAEELKDKEKLKLATAAATRSASRASSPRSTSSCAARRASPRSRSTRSGGRRAASSPAGTRGRGTQCA